MNALGALAIGQPSALGSVYVINRTRFATEDLMAVVNRVEARAAQEDDGAPPRLARRHLDSVPFFARLLIERIAAREGWLPAGALPGEGVTPLWILEHHAPVPPEHFHGFVSTDIRLRWAVPDPEVGWSSGIPGGRLLLAAPEQIHENPLRRLLQAASGEREVPSELVADLRFRLLALFHAYRYGSLVQAPDGRDLRVRVRSPAAPLPAPSYPAQEAA